MDIVLTVRQQDCRRFSRSGLPQRRVYDTWRHSLISLREIITWLEEIEARGALEALVEEDREFVRDVLEHAKNYDRLRTHHAIVEAEVMQLRKDKERNC